MCAGDFHLRPCRWHSGFQPCWSPLPYCYRCYRLSITSCRQRKNRLPDLTEAAYCAILFLTSPPVTLRSWPRTLTRRGAFSLDCAPTLARDPRKRKSPVLTWARLCAHSLKTHSSDGSSSLTIA